MSDLMPPEKTSLTIDIIATEIESEHLDRTVKVDAYVPGFLEKHQRPALLLINDGQDMATMNWIEVFREFLQRKGSILLIAVAMHAGTDRKMEYGTAAVPDYLGRGAKAAAYTKFVFEELLPTIRLELGYPEFSEKVFAGFSLGGLSALDIVWAHPHEFTKVGVFSGSLWWRMLDQTEPEYDDDKHRIMHDLVRKGNYAPWLKFFFCTGTLDETNDRNGNGIIDSIDDTLGLMTELERKGYNRASDMYYLELPDGRHDVATWGKAMPVFLDWAFAG
jgi:enterochelin esterase-like enzyme